MDKIQKLVDRQRRIQSRIQTLTKELQILALRIEYLRQDEVLRQSDASLLGLPEGDGPRIRAEVAGQLPGEALPPPDPSPPKKPKQAKGPVCNSCGAENTLYPTTRTLNNGKMVQLVVCDECKTEQII